MAAERTYSKKNPRIPFFYWAFAFAFVVLIVALGYRQIYLYDFYVERGGRQSMRRVIEPGTRGDIYDRNGRLIVTNKPIFSAVVYFNDIRKEFREEYFKLKKIELAKLASVGSNARPNYAEITERARSNVLNGYLAQINGILGTNYSLGIADYNKHFLQKQLLPLPLVRNLTEREHAILAERIPVDSPIQIYTGTSRYYPYGDVASHALGYVANNFDDDISKIPGSDLRTYAIVPTIGRSGIEAAFDSKLAGTSGAKIWVVDLAGYKYENVLDISPTKGGDVFTSLDIEIQQVIEEAFGGRKGAAVMLDVNSGEVLALVSRPSYDPNMLTPYITHKVDREITERGAWLNRATSGLYPPGSTFKVVTATAGLRSGAIDENSVKTCTGGYRVGSRIFPCNSRWGHGNLDLVGALAHSCNVYFYETGIDAGIESIADTAKLFGFGESTGIELKEESWRRTIVATPEFKRKRRKYDGPWTNGDTANASIGQGYMLFTPLQVASFAASFARGETRTKLSMLHDSRRKTDAAYHGAEKIPLTKSQYDKILEGMVAATERGTSKRARVAGVKVAAKSGTAQVSVNGRPLTLAWLIAFAPAESPEVAMAVIVEGEEPGDVGGGRTAAPIVGAAFKKYFSGANGAAVEVEN